MPVPILARNALLTLNEARRALGFNEGDPSGETLLIEQINRASRLAESYCCTVLRQQTVTRTLDGPGGRVLWLPDIPIVRITSLTNDDTAVTSTDYRIVPALGKLWLTGDGTLGAWDSEPANIVATYVAGYGIYNAADFTAWVTATAYVVGDLRAGKAAGSYTQRVYECTVGHTSGATTEPGVGVDWATVWEEASDSSQGAMPEDLKQAAVELLEWVRRAPEYTGVQTEGEDGMTVAYTDGGLPPNIGAKLVPYRRAFV